eukprot:4555174-Alexandrium_andersonii.AAC.1
MPERRLPPTLQMRRRASTAQHCGVPPRRPAKWGAGLAERACRECDPPALSAVARGLLRAELIH